MYNLGLIGKHVKHSFSKHYFQNKFKKEKLKKFSYESYELNQISEYIDNVENYQVLVQYKNNSLSFLHKVERASSNEMSSSKVSFFSSLISGSGVSDVTDALALSLCCDIRMRT